MQILNENKIINKIFHISDIHVMKNNNRDEEYNDVFNELCKKIAENKINDKTLIVCTGDIFDNGLSPSSIILVKKLFMDLAKISDIIVIRGNHDGTSRSNNDSIDFLFPVLYKLKTKNTIHLLQESGIYQYGNIIFGYTDYFEKAVVKLDTNMYEDKVKIGLWHGTISGSKTDYNMSLEGKFGTDAFESYDYVLLGDIHKHQYLDKNKRIWYSGSLLQLNHGENIKGHGYVELDLMKKTSCQVDIHNDYGFLTVYVKNNKIVKYDESEVPKNINLRIIHEESDEDKVNAIYDKIKSKHNILSYSKMEKKYQIEYLNEKTDEDTEILKDNETSINKLMEYIEKNDKNITSNEKKEIEKILKDKMTELNYEYDTTTRNMKLKNVMFNNFNIYNENNVIDYENLKGIINLSGENGTGKSSLIQVLIYGIYGSCEHEMTKKFDYINNDKKKMEIMITIDINNVEYNVYRACYFRGKKRDSTNVENDVIIYENGKDITSKSLTSINKQIDEIFGPKDDFLRLCIMEQKTKKSFVDYKDNEKTEYICKILKLDVYNEIVCLLEDDVKLLKKEIKKNEEKDSNSNVADLNNLKMLKEEHEKNIIVMKEEYDNINKKKIECELKMEELKDLNDVKIYEKINDDLKTKLKKLVMEKIDLDKKLKDKKKLNEDNDKILEQFKDVEKTNEIFEKEKKLKINNINDEINKLMLEIIENNIDYEELDNVKSAKLEKEKSICSIVKKRKDLNNKLTMLEKNIFEYENDKKNAKYYKKYKDYESEIDTMENDKLHEIDNLKEVSKSNKKLETEYKKHCKDYDASENKIQIIREKLNNIKFENIDEKKKNFEMKKTKEIQRLNDEIQDDLKKYNVIDIKIDIKELTKNIEKKEKEHDNLQKENASNKDFYEKTNLKIAELNKEYPKNLTEMYEKYIAIKNAIDNKMVEFNKETAKYENLLNHLELLKNHEYNENCEICMKNKMTTDLIATQQNVKSQEVKINNISKELQKYNKEIQEYEQYHTMYKNKENEMKDKNILIEQKDKCFQKILLLEEKIKNLLSDIDSLKEKKNCYYNNKSLDETIEKNKKLLTIETNKTFDEYDEYLDLKLKLQKEEENIKILSLKKKEYENVKENLNNIQKKIDEYDSIILKKKETFAKYEKYNDKYVEYNSQKNDFYNETKEKEMLEIQEEKEKANLELYIHKIKEYEIKINLEKKNDEIRDIVTMKKKMRKEYEDEKDDAYEKYKVLKDNKNKFEIEISNLTLKYTNICSDEKECMCEITDNGKKMEKVIYKKQLKTEYEIICNQFDDINKQYNQKNEIILLLNKEIMETEINVANIKQKKEENNLLKCEMDLKEKICHVIKNGYIDNLLSNDIIPGFCSGVNAILSSFVNYKIHMEYNNKKIALYKKDNNDLLSNAVQLSGYESLMLEIAMRIFINSRNKLQKVNFFVIDEGFSFCDEKSLQKVEKLFVYLRKLYDFTIVVSHNEQIKLYTDKDLIINHKNGISHVNYICEKTNIDKNKNLFIKLSGNKEVCEKTILDKKQKVDYKSLNKKNKKEKIIEE